MVGAVSVNADEVGVEGGFLTAVLGMLDMAPARTLAVLCIMVGALSVLSVLSGITVLELTSEVAEEDSSPPLKSAFSSSSSELVSLFSTPPPPFFFSLTNIADCMP